MNAPASSQTPPRHRWLSGAAALLLVALPGCGGGDVESPAGPPPQMSLAAAPAAAHRGNTVQLMANVTAANGIDTIDFYRVDDGKATAIGRVSGPPYQLTTAIPLNAVWSVSYYAYVCDYTGQCTSSPLVDIAILYRWVGAEPLSPAPIHS